MLDLLALVFLLPQLPDYKRDIEPIWEKHCFDCHYSGVKIGSFEMGTYDELMQSGPNGPLVVPGKPRESRLYRMLSGDIEPMMPLGAEKLAAKELELIRLWIEAGAKGPAGRPTK